MSSPNKSTAMQTAEVKTSSNTCIKPNVRRSKMFQIIRKTNFYTKEPVRILRIQLLNKVWFYHITYRKFL